MEAQRIRKNPAKKGRRALVAILLLILLTGAGTGGYFAYTYRSDIAVSPDFESLPERVTHEPISCQDIAQGAVGTVSLGVLSTCGEQTPFPLASMTKVLTALVVVHDFSDPLDTKISLDTDDVALYSRELERNGSNIKVEVPGEYTVQQMLEGMVVASSNNFADSLVTHLYGDLESYLARARAFLAENGLSAVEVGGDASGFDPQNKASAKDMFQIGVLAMKSPATKQIVALKTVELPVYTLRGTFTETEKSTTYMHFSNPDAYLGVKSGTNDEAGRNLTFAAPFTPPSLSGGSAEVTTEEASEDGNPKDDALADEDVLVGVMMGGDDDYNYHQVLDYRASVEEFAKPIQVLTSGVHLGVAKVKTLFGELSFTITAAEDFEASLPKETELSYELETWQVERDRYAGKLHIFANTLHQPGQDAREEIASIPCSVSQNPA